LASEDNMMMVLSELLASEDDMMMIWGWYDDDMKMIWWWFYQKRIVCIKLDIYVFI
jgi:hypothetical protein